MNLLDYYIYIYMLLKSDRQSSHFAEVADDDIVSDFIEIDRFDALEPLFKALEGKSSNEVRSGVDAAQRRRFCGLVLIDDSGVKILS